MSGINIVVNETAGVYIPQFFVDYCKEGWLDIRSEDIEIIAAGPEHEWYWEAWNDVMQSANYIDPYGNKWHLYKDGDLFAICEELMTEEEYYNFFGEERAA